MCRAEGSIYFLLSTYRVLPLLSSSDGRAVEAEQVFAGRDGCVTSGAECGSAGYRRCHLSRSCRDGLHRLWPSGLIRIRELRRRPIRV